jgi:hypothetical protein
MATIERIYNTVLAFALERPETPIISPQAKRKGESWIL